MGGCNSSTALASRRRSSGARRLSDDGTGKGEYFAPVNEETGEFLRPQFYRERVVAGTHGKVRWKTIEDQTEELKDEEILQVIEPIFGKGLLNRKETLKNCSEDLLVRCVRAFVNNKPETTKWITAMGEMSTHAAAVGEGIEKILKWRSDVEADSLLKKELDKAADFHRLWPFYCGGTDEFGHLIFFERLSEIKHTQILEKYKVEDILKYRAQAHELIQYWQIKEGWKRNIRLNKHIHVIDLAGVTMTDFSKLKKILPPIFKQTGDQYPNSLYKLFITNAPSLFTTIWWFVKPLLDPETTLKINPTGNNEKTIQKMKAAGIERSAIPVWLGGSHKLETVKVLIDQVLSEGGPEGRFMETPIPEKLVERMTKLRKMNSGESPSPRASVTPKFFSEEMERSTISDTSLQHTTRSMEKETLNSSKKKKLVLRIACALAVLLLLLFLFLVDLFFVTKLEDAMNNAARAGREEEGGRSSNSSIGNNGSADIV